MPILRTSLWQAAELRTGTAAVNVTFASRKDLLFFFFGRTSSFERSEQQVASQLLCDLAGSALTRLP